MFLWLPAHPPPYLPGACPLRAGGLVCLSGAVGCCLFNAKRSPVHCPHKLGRCRRCRRGSIDPCFWELRSAVPSEPCPGAKYSYVFALARKGADAAAASAGTALTRPSTHTVRAASGFLPRGKTATPETSAPKHVPLSKLGPNAQDVTWPAHDDEKGFCMYRSNQTLVIASRSRPADLQQ